MASDLATAGVVAAPGLVDRRLASLLYTTLLLRCHRDEARRDDHMPSAFSFWGDSTLDGVHLTLLPQIEAIVGEALLPTYCYARIYRNGDRLAPHHDREACEIVATILVGHRGAPPPPISFRTGQSVGQQIGDAVVFYGSIEHWRETFHGHDFGQVFMNFVRANGPSRQLLFDGRYQAFPAELVPAAARAPRA